MFVYGAFGDQGGATLLVVLLFALALDAVIGDPRWFYRIFPHPVALVGRAAAWCDRRLNRPQRSERARRLRGLLMVVAFVLAAWWAGQALAWFGRVHPQSWLVEMAVVMVLMAQRSLFDHVHAVERALSREGLEAGRRAVSHIVGRDPSTLDEHGVVRAAIESLAENFSDGVVAPAFWYVLLGLPGLLVYKTVNTLDSMVGHRTSRHAAFGWASARLDDLLNLIPARLSGLIIAAAAPFVPDGRPLAALRIMLRDAGKHRSLNAGWPEAAMAGALDLALAGPRRYPNLVVQDPWIGDGRARATTRDLQRALYLFGIACLVHAGLIAALALVLAAS